MDGVVLKTGTKKASEKAGNWEIVLYVLTKKFKPMFKKKGKKKKRQKKTHIDTLWRGLKDVSQSRKVDI